VIRAGGYASALVAVSCALSSCSSKSDCPNGHCTADFTWPEGGEIRVEFVGTPSGSLSRGIAFFKSAQTPELTPFPAVAPTGGGVCNDLSATPTWPTAPATFTEMDVGDLSITGGGETFAFTKQTHFTDFLGRTHDVAYAFQDAARMVTPSTLSDVVMTGSSVTSPATWFGALGMPADFQLVPAELPAHLVIPRGQDLAVAWQRPPQIIGQRVWGWWRFSTGTARSRSSVCRTSRATASTCRRRSWRRSRRKGRSCAVTPPISFANSRRGVAST
jgi:hypothetical protein